MRIYLAQKKNYFRDNSYKVIYSVHEKRKIWMALKGTPSSKN